MPRPRDAWLLLAAIAFAVGCGFSLGPPRLLWLNTGVRVHYGWPPAAGALLAAVAALAAAALTSRRSLRVAGILAAAALGGFGLHRLVYRFEAGDAGLAERGLGGSTSVPWRDVVRVDSGDRGLVVTSSSGERVHLRTGNWDPQTVAQLERTIARRVRETVR